MRVTYCTFSSTSAYTAEVATFKDLVSDIRGQLKLDDESKVTVVCGGKIFRDTRVLLQDILSIGKPVVVRYDLSDAVIQRRKQERRIIRAVRKSPTINPASNPANNPSMLVIMDDCQSSQSSISTSNTFRDIYNHGRNIPINPFRPTNVANVSVEDEPANSPDNEERKEAPIARAPVRRPVADLAALSGDNNSNNGALPTIEEIAVIAATISDSDRAWEVFAGSEIPQPFAMLGADFIRNVRRTPEMLRAFVSALYNRDPDIVRSMMEAASEIDSDDEPDDDMPPLEDEDEEHVQSPRLVASRHAESSSDSDDVSSSENDNNGNNANNSNNRAASGAPPRPRSAVRILTPNQRVVVGLISEMMLVTPEVAESALRNTGFDQNAAIDYIQNGGVEEPLPAPIEDFMNLLIASGHGEMQQMAGGNIRLRRAPGNPPGLRLNAAVSGSYNEDFDGDEVNNDYSVMEEVD